MMLEMVNRDGDDNYNGINSDGNDNCTTIIIIISS